MGIFNWLGFNGSSVTSNKSTGLAIASPWANEGNLKTVLLSDIFSQDIVDNLPLSRSEAMSVPVVSRARNLLVGSIARFPLVALDANGPLTNQPAWLYRTDTAVTPYERLAWTIDDLIHYGYSLWEVERGSAGQILKANWTPMSDWSMEDGFISIRGTRAPEGSYIFFNSPFEGLLSVATRTLKGAIALERSWVSKVQNPIPLTVLRSSATDGLGLEQDEIDDLLAQWRKARQDPNGALGYLPPGLTMDTHGETDPALLIEGRNAVRTDIASFLNLPVSLLDGTSGIDSLTYTTSENQQSRFYTETIPFWTDAIESRLSMDDCVPRGTRVRLDKTELYTTTPNPTDAPEAD